MCGFWAILSLRVDLPVEKSFQLGRHIRKTAIWIIVEPYSGWT